MAQDWVEVVVLLAPSGHWQYAEGRRQVAWGRVRPSSEEQQRLAIRRQAEWQCKFEPPRSWPYVEKLEDAFELAVRVRRRTLRMLRKMAIKG